MTTEERFAGFHERNPQVYEELVKLARMVKRNGLKKVSIKMLYEHVRWNRFIFAGTDDYKLNNNYHSHYARMIMDNEEDLQGMFETRGLKARV